MANRPAGRTTRLPSLITSVIESDRGQRIGRYGLANALLGMGGLVGFLILVLGFGAREVTSTIVITLLGIPPSYVLNKRWVWRASGREHLVRELIPFFFFAFLGLAVGAVSVALAVRIGSAGSLLRLVVVMSANVLALVLVSVLRFLVLDLVTFAPRIDPARQA